MSTIRASSGFIFIRLGISLNDIPASYNPFMKKKNKLKVRPCSYSKHFIFPQKIKDSFTFPEPFLLKA